ncbi:MAG TPA: hypothetical protein VEC08_05490 [Nitrososphaerales archaeon]|nr:hypothetical protein [Nitrososphaerales archaeon]
MSREYLSSEDSALLRGVVRNFAGEGALEIGAGNGGNLIALAKSFNTVVGTDLVTPGMRDWKGHGANYLLSDAASCIRPHSIDLVVFNPPYLQGEPKEDRATNAGAAFEVPLRFLMDALRTVKPKGRIVMLLNDQAPMHMFEEECAKHGFGLAKVANKHLFFEELAVYVASSTSFRSETEPHTRSVS